MDVYGAFCTVCNMKGQIRFSRREATRIAREHSIETGHPVKVTTVGISDKEKIIEE